MTRYAYIQEESSLDPTESTLARQREQIEQHFHIDQTVEEICTNPRERPQLHALLDHLKSGDSVIVSSFEHFSPNFMDCVPYTEMIRKKEGRLIALDFPMSLEENMSQLFLNFLIQAGTCQIQLKKRKTRRGIERAKKKNKYKGRKPLLTDEIKEEIINRYDKEGHSISKIAGDMKISRNTIYNFFMLHRNPNPSKKFIFDLKKDVTEFDRKKNVIEVDLKKAPEILKV